MFKIVSKILIEHSFRKYKTDFKIFNFTQEYQVD